MSQGGSEKDRRHQRDMDMERKGKYTKRCSRCRTRGKCWQMGIRFPVRDNSNSSYSTNSDSDSEGIVVITLASKTMSFFDSPNEGSGSLKYLMANGPMVTHPEFIDLHNDNDDLLGEEVDLMICDSHAKVCESEKRCSSKP